MNPKKGKRLMYKKSIAPVKRTALYKSVPYVRAGRATIKSRPEREVWGRQLKDIYKATAVGLVHLLRKDKILWKLEGTQCPFCKRGVLGKLKFYKRRKSMAHRCGRHGCQQYVLPHHDNPLFTTGGGHQAASLEDQAALLFTTISGANSKVSHRITGKNDKMIRGMSQRLSMLRRIVVERDEKKIKFGQLAEWNDVEADEMDLGKSLCDHENVDDPECTTNWEQWQGLVERGNPKSLVLKRTRPKKTKDRAPGPGPIKKTDWAPIAAKFLKNTKVILHTDGAKSYRLKTTPVDRILHDWVVHKKK